MTVTVKETTLGRCVVARCDDRLVCVAVEDEDHWRIVAGSLPAIRVATFEDAVEWVTHLDDQAAAHRASGDVVAVRGDDLKDLLGLFRRISKRPLPSTVRVWIDPIDRAVKFKINASTWTRPVGQIEEEATA